MKEFLSTFIRFLLFSAVFIIVLVSISGELSPTKYLVKNLKYKTGATGHLNTRIKEVKKISNVDILFLGSSHSYRGFDPRIFMASGLNSFNLGSSSQTHIQTEVLLKRYLKKLNPKLIIYEVYPGAFSSDGIESGLDIISNDKNDFESIKMSIKLNHFFLYNTIIYAVYRDLFSRNIKTNENKIINNDKYISGGYVEKKLVFYTDNKAHMPTKLKINKGQLKAFKNNLSLIKSLDINYILVEAPITKSLYKSFTNKQEFNNEMLKHGTFLDYNLKLNDSLHFYDSHHLNQNGVKAFNIELIKYISKLNVPLKNSNIKIQKTLW